MQADQIYVRAVGQDRRFYRAVYGQWQGIDPGV